MSSSSFDSILAPFLASTRLFTSFVMSLVLSCDEKAYAVLLRDRHRNKTFFSPGLAGLNFCALKFHFGKRRQAMMFNRGSGASFSHYRCRSRFRRVASCDGSTRPGLQGNTRITVFCFDVCLFAGNPGWRACYSDPGANLLTHHVRHHSIRTASCTSAMFVERLHKKAIQAFKCFRWMLDGTNHWIGHFYLIPVGENQWKAFRCSASLDLPLWPWGSLRVEQSQT